MTDNQALIDAVEPPRRLEYGRWQAPLEPKRRAIPLAQPHTPEPQRRSPLPSVREIDRQLEQKYGAPRYQELQSWRASRSASG